MRRQIITVTLESQSFRPLIIARTHAAESKDALKSHDGVVLRGRSDGTIPDSWELRPRRHVLCSFKTMTSPRVLNRQTYRRNLAAPRSATPRVYRRKPFDTALPHNHAIIVSLRGFLCFSIIADGNISGNPSKKQNTIANAFLAVLPDYALRL